MGLPSFFLLLFLSFHLWYDWFIFMNEMNRIPAWTSFSFMISSLPPKNKKAKVLCIWRGVETISEVGFQRASAPAVTERQDDESLLEKGVDFQPKRQLERICENCQSVSDCRADTAVLNHYSVLVDTLVGLTFYAMCWEETWMQMKVVIQMKIKGWRTISKKKKTK